MADAKWRGLTVESAKRFYDKFGSKQDKQGFYEDHALNKLLEQGRFAEAHSVFELGCGTGRFAELLFRAYLPIDALYTGVDVSTTMLHLSRKRLLPFSTRVRLESAADFPVSSLESNSFDRFVSNYVFDLLSEDDATFSLTEARRILTDKGFLCLTSMTHGSGPITHLVSSSWNMIFQINPAWVGGCRPITLLSSLNLSQWNVVYHNVGSQFAVTSEVIVASPVKQQSTKCV